jgi:putative spermidine/putrescine transport system substrate-binding protein
MTIEGLSTTRRSAVAAIAVLIGSATFPLVAAAQAPQSEGQVVLGGYGGTLEQLMRDQIIPAFEKETGIKVQYVVGTALSNYSKVLASRTNPEIDVYWSNELTHAAGKQQGLYDKLDPAIVTNLVDVNDIAKDQDGIGVASYVMATGIEYNTKALADAGIPTPTSWQDLWNPKLKGKVALYSFGVAYSQDLLAILARLGGGSENDVRPAVEKVKQLKDMGNLVAFASSPAELDNMMVQGQAWITVNGSPRAFILKERGAPIDFSFPKEGAGFFTNYFDVVKDAPHPKAAQILVNFLIKPETQLAIATGAVAAPINKKVQVPPSLEKQVPLGDEMLAKMIRIDRSVMNTQLDNWADMWSRQIEGR